MKNFMSAVGATFILILLGDGVVANVGLAPRLASVGYDWNTIVFGWCFAVVASGYIAGGANNPALQLALAIRGDLKWGDAINLMIGTFVGAFLGALGVYLCYRDGLVAAGVPNVWCTGPGSVFGNTFWGGAATAQAAGSYSLLTACITEFIGTVVLMWSVLALGHERNKTLGVGGTFFVAGIVLAIGLSLGGPSGYAINPARDLGPRIFGLVVGTKGLFDGSYWILPPVIMTCLGAIVGSFTWDMLFASKPEPKAEAKLQAR
jgi:glycerol uptake facilitator protein